MKINKKAQVSTMTGDVIGTQVAQILFFGLVVFGVIQLFAFLAPNFGISLDDFITKYFGGGTVIFLFIAAGSIGVAINEALAQLSVQNSPFTSRIGAFIAVGALVAVFGWVFGYFVDSGIVTNSFVNSMLLP
jgi:hypothetical protein